MHPSFDPDGGGTSVAMTYSCGPTYLDGGPLGIGTPRRSSDLRRCSVFKCQRRSFSVGFRAPQVKRFSPMRDIAMWTRAIASAALIVVADSPASPIVDRSVCPPAYGRSTC